MRVVSLCPSITETLHALGAWDDLVGRTRYCVHPRERVGDVVHVRGTKNPDVAAIVALEPDLVLMNREENRKEDVEALRAAGLDVHVSFPVTLDDTEAYLEELGELVGRPSEGRRLRAELARERGRAAATLDAAYLIWRDPWMVAGSETFIAELLAEAGIRLQAPGPRYPEVDAGYLAGCGALLLSSEPFDFGAVHRDELVWATGLSPERVLLCDGELLSWHGSRTAAGLRYARELAALLQPAEG